MLRIISAVVSIIWAALLGGAGTIAMVMQVTPGVQGQRVIVITTYALVPLVAAIMALVQRASLPLIVSWALLAGTTVQKLQFDLSQRGFTATNVALLAVSVAALIVSVLSRREDHIR